MENQGRFGGAEPESPAGNLQSSIFRVPYVSDRPPANLNTEDCPVIIKPDTNDLTSSPRHSPTRRLTRGQTSQLRLVSAICMEVSDEWETGTIHLNVNEL